MNRHLAAFDFDGFIARTFDDSPNGMNVNVASRKAVLDVFGEKGLMAYESIGGLQGREPGELVKAIQKVLGNDGSEDLASQFVDAKLSYLVPEISPEWPKLNPGMAEFNQSVKNKEIPIDLAVVSSGHDAFISRVLEINGINAILVTSDILRKREVEGKFKPNPYQLAEAHRQWQRGKLDGQLFSFGIPNQFVGRQQNKQNILYGGDDPGKDGAMAEASRVVFVFMPFTHDGFSPKAEKGQLYLSDFHALRKILIRQTKELEDGASFVEAFFGKGDWEIFHQVPEEERPWARMMRERSV